MRSISATASLLVCLALALAAVPARAQAPAPAVPDNALNSTDTIGLPPEASSEGTTEQVDLSSGALTMFLPVLTLPQRQGSQPLTLGFTYDSNQLNLQQDIFASPGSYPTGDQNDFEVEDSYSYTITASETGLDAGPLQLNLPQLVGSLEYEGDSLQGANIGNPPTPAPEFCLTNIVFIDWAGTAHSFPTAIPNCSDENVADDVIPISPIYKADSSDNLFYRLDASNPNDFTVTAPDGTVYHFANPNIPCPSAASIPCFISQNAEQYLHQTASSIVDRNGATITIANGVITDTLGRTITYSSDFSTGTTVIGYTDSNGNPQTVTIAMEDTFEPIPGVSGPDVGPTLQDNSCFYTVVTNPEPPGTQYSPLQIVTTPTPPGGQGGPAGTGFTPYDITFSGSGKHYHMLFDSFGHLMKIVYPSGGYHRYDYADLGIGIDQGPIECGWAQTQVAHRYECSSSTGSCGAEATTTYSYNANPTTVTTPDGTVTEHIFGASDPLLLNNLETDTAVVSSSGTKLKETQYSYSLYNNGYGGWGQNAVYPFPTTVTTTLYGGSSPVTSQVNYSYDTVSTATPYEDPHTGNPTQIDVYGYDGTHLKSTMQTWWDGGDNILNRLASSTVTDPTTGNSSTVAYTYDNNGNVTSKAESGISYAGGNPVTTGPYTTTVTSFDAYYRPLAIEDPRGATTTYSYSDAACPASGPATSTMTVTNALGQATVYGYDACMGLVTSITDPNQQTSTYQYDGVGRPVGISYPDTGGRIFSYNGDALPLTTTTTVIATLDPNIVTNTVYDGLDRVTETQLTSDPGGIDYVDTTYDNMGRVASVSNPYRSTSDPTYALFQYTYDALGRPATRCHLPDWDCEHWTYTGSRTDYQDPSYLLTAWYTDALGRMTQYLEPNTTDVATIPTNYTYDAFGNLTSVDQVGVSGETPRVRGFVYDGLSRLISATNPESGTDAYSYDANGNVLSRTDARGIVTSYTYDALNRVLSKSYANDPQNTPSVSYLWDTSFDAGWEAIPGYNNPIGHLTQALTTVNGTPEYDWLTLGYDQMGRSFGYETCAGISAVNCGSLPLLFGDWDYDDAGHIWDTISSFQTASGVEAWIDPSFSFDGAGNVASLTIYSIIGSLTQQPNTLNVMANAAYTAFGGLSSAGLSLDSNNNPQMTLARSYDTRLRLDGETDTAVSTQTPLYQYAASLDPDGDMTSSNDSVTGSWTYNPDFEHRLDGMTSTGGYYNGAAIWIGYDSFGNRLNLWAGGSAQVPLPESGSTNYNANNQAQTGIVYDASGNVTDDGNNQYLYDAEGRLCAVNPYGTVGDMVGYVYDGMGNRTAKGTITTFSCDITKNGFAATNYFVYGPNGEVLAESDGNFNLIYANAFLNGHLLATYTADGNPHYNFTDLVGTKRVAASAGGTTEETCLSLPFGDGLNCSGSDVSELHFTGKPRDQESGNDYFNARYYASNYGRFLSPDPGWRQAANPQNPQSWNQYVYVGNNPLTLTDPTGMAPQGGEAGCQGNTPTPSETSHKLMQNGTGGTIVTYNTPANCNSSQQGQGQNGAVGNIPRLSAAALKALEGAEGTTDVLVGAGKIGGAIAAGSNAEAAGPLAPAVALGAAYAGISGTVQMVQGAVLLGGAATGYTQQAQTTADFLGAVSTISGLTTLMATEDAPAASQMSSFEGLLTGAATRSIFNSMQNFTDAVMNGVSLVTGGQEPACNADVCTGTSTGATQ